jgi:hypothetical protein
MQHEYQFTRVRINYDDTKHAFYLSLVINVGIRMNRRSPTFRISKNTTTMALPFAKPDGMALWY